MCLTVHEKRRKYGTAIRAEIGASVGDIHPLGAGTHPEKADLAQEFHVTQRSIQRDVEDLRCFLAERHLEREVIYDGKQRGYRMVSGNPRGLTNSEI